MQIQMIALLALFVIAMLYSSVGHGGASGYLAVLVLAGYMRPDITPVVLILNIAVASTGLFHYRRAGHFSFKLLKPLVITSIPAAFVGGMIPLNDEIYAALLGFILLIAALRFLFVAHLSQTRETSVLISHKTWALALGAVLGLLAGMVGVGGGIFLSPLLLFLGWADAKKTAAVSAAFIVFNSMSGLSAHLLLGAVIDWSLLSSIAVTIYIGGFIGSFLGAWRLSLRMLQQLLGSVLAIASFKLIIKIW